MALPHGYAAQSCMRTLRLFHLPRTSLPLLRPISPSARRNNSALSATSFESPKIAAIVDQIGQLTLLETADLVSSLKSRLKIPDMPMGGFALAAPAAAAAPEEKFEEEPVAVKTLFTLKLVSFEAASKAKVIKEVKSMLGLSLVDSKKFVESAPKTLKENVIKDDAEKIIATMKSLGAIATMD